MDKKINIEKFEAFVQKAFKLSTEEMSSLYNQDGELTDFALIEKKDAERVSKLSTDKTNQYNRGLKEGAGKLEKELKDKYEVESDLIGVDLFDHIIEIKLADVKADPGDVMKNPEVIKLVNAHGKEIKTLKKEYEDKLSAKEAEVNYNNLLADIESEGIVELRSLNPIFSENPARAKNQEGVFLKELRNFKYKKEGKEVIVLKPDGTNLTDEHGHSVTYKEHVKNIGEMFYDFKAASDRNSPGNVNKGGGGPQSKKVRMPKDSNDYIDMMRDNSLTPQERIEIKNLWTSKNK